MAYVAPNSTVKMLQGVPLDKTYEHTIYFDQTNQIQGRQDQYDYFNSFCGQGRTYTALSYVRRDRGVIRIKDNAVNLLNCNYMMYQNTAYNPYFWFYAFVTGVEYVNDGTTEVSFEIDVMQTWYWNFRLGYCFIERQHVINDEIGRNTIPENLEMGEYMYEDMGAMTEFTQWAIVIAATFSGTYNASLQEFVFTESSGGLYGGVYSGLYYNVFASADYASANQFLLDATTQNKADGIVSVFMVPASFTRVSSAGTPYSGLKTFFKDYNWTYVNGDYPARGPRNNKLYTYPYNLLYVTDQQGNGAEYRYEFFLWASDGDTRKCQFELQGLMSPNSECQLIPAYYNQDTNIVLNLNERITLSDFPQCSFNTDAYKAWLAQQGGFAGRALDYTKVLSSGAFGALSSLASPVNIVSPIAGVVGAASAGMNTFLGVADLVRETNVHQAMPPVAHGQQSNGIGVASKTIGFRVYRCHVRPEYAKIIDDFFDKYGYAIHQNDVPNLRTRTRWTYVKTRGCEFAVNNMPADDARAIAAIFDSGITFWAYRGSVADTKVGDYSDYNYPLATAPAGA